MWLQKSKLCVIGHYNQEKGTEVVISENFVPESPNCQIQ